eukprot:845743-Amorphochlora_amoeboformis.AAC.1
MYTSAAPPKLENFKHPTLPQLTLRLELSRVIPKPSADAKSTVRPLGDIALSALVTWLPVGAHIIQVVIRTPGVQPPGVGVIRYALNVPRAEAMALRAQADAKKSGFLRQLTISIPTYVPFVKKGLQGTLDVEVGVEHTTASAKEWGYVE